MAHGAETAAGAVKWHPGHYVAVEKGSRGASDTAKAAYAELDSNPALRGALVRVSWADLEPSKGNYDFHAIEKQLNEMAAHKKQLVVLLQTKLFGYPNDGPAAPDYVLTEPEFEGGVFRFATGAGGADGGREHARVGRRGSNLKLWNTPIYERLSALMTALGKRFNASPNFEALVLQETALSATDEAITPQQEDAFFDNLLKLHAQLRASFPNTVTMQLTNYPVRKLGLLTSRFKAMGTGMGGPDVFLTDPGLNRPNGAYSYYPQLSGAVPLGVMVAAGNYVATRHGGPKNEAPSVDQLHSFARDRLKVNYIFWVSSTDHSPHFPRVLEILNQPELRSDPAGGLSKACPSAFSSCTN